MTCNKAWISSLDWAFFLWFLWTSFNQNMDILRVKLVHKTFFVGLAFPCSVFVNKLYSKYGYIASKAC
jgi:hypothetical protein